MARPASRGGAMPFQGGAGRGGPVAGGMYRPPSGAGAMGGGGGTMMRQPTVGTRGMRPMSGMKTRGGTGSIQPGMPLQPSVGLSTDVQVDHRPVTQQGLTGMHTQPLGPGRQIADKSYYLSELRNKLTDITQEISRLEKESVQIDEDNATHAVYKRKFDDMIAEVRTLEGELADFNLALDKLRTNANVEEIKEQTEKLKRSNTSASKQVDDVFLRGARVQKATKGVEFKMRAIQDKAAQRMTELDEDARDEYSELTEERDSLNEGIREKNDKLDRLLDAIGERRHKLESEAYQIHNKGVDLEKKKKYLLSAKMDLEEETQSSMTPDQMKEKLLEKVKTANNEISVCERKTKEYEELLDQYSDMRRDKEQELLEARKHAQKAKKYEAVYDRDHKMQEFIDKFPEALKGEDENKEKLKTTIVALLKHISKGLAVQQNLPDVEQLSEMRGELSFKKQKMQNSANTLNLLSKDLEKRKEELQAISSLDTKINLELGTLKDKIKKMNEDMDGFKPKDELEKDAAEAKKRLLKDNIRWKKQRDMIKQQVVILNGQFDKRKKEKEGNETAKKLESQEAKLKGQLQGVFTMQEYIASRKRDSDYGSMKTQCSGLSTEINKFIIQQVNSKV